MSSDSVSSESVSSDSESVSSDSESSECSRICFDIICETFLFVYTTADAMDFVDEYKTTVSDYRYYMIC